MAILKNVWRFQCDPDGSDDPTVQVFLKKVITDPDTGEAFEKQDTIPVLMKFSELTGGLMDLIDAEKVGAVAEAQAEKNVSAEPIGVVKQPVPLTKRRARRKVSNKSKQRVRR